METTDAEKFITLFDYLLDILEGKVISENFTDVAFSATQYSDTMSVDFMLNGIPCNIRTYNTNITWHNKAENARFNFQITKSEFDRIEERILFCYNISKRSFANFYDIIQSEKRNVKIDDILKEL